jgi:hypothetical protein
MKNSFAIAVAITIVFGIVCFQLLKSRWFITVNRYPHEKSAGRHPNFADMMRWMTLKATEIIVFLACSWIGLVLGTTNFERKINLSIAIVIVFVGVAFMFIANEWLAHHFANWGRETGRDAKRDGAN